LVTAINKDHPASLKIRGIRRICQVLREFERELKRKFGFLPFGQRNLYSLVINAGKRMGRIDFILSKVKGWARW
jgi:hypothetical protein